MAAQDHIKICNICGTAKPANQFSKKADSKDGLHPNCKECSRLITKAWREKNAERAAESCLKWREAHREYLREKALEHYRQNKEKRLVSMRQWQRENRSKIMETRRVYVSANKEAIAAGKRLYKARKRNAEGKHTGEDVKRLMVLQRKRCANCGTDISSDYHVDHVIPLSKGGGNGADNIQLLCPTCNIRKKDKDPIAFANQMGRLL